MPEPRPPVCCWIILSIGGCNQKLLSACPSLCSLADIVNAKSLIVVDHVSRPGVPFSATPIIKFGYARVWPACTLLWAGTVRRAGSGLDRARNGAVVRFALARLQRRSRTGADWAAHPLKGCSLPWRDRAVVRSRSRFCLDLKAPCTEYVSRWLNSRRPWNWTKVVCRCVVLQSQERSSLLRHRHFKRQIAKARVRKQTSGW